MTVSKKNTSNLKKKKTVTKARTEFEEQEKYLFEQFDITPETMQTIYPSTCYFDSMVQRFIERRRQMKQP